MSLPDQIHHHRHAHGDDARGHGAHRKDAHRQDAREQGQVERRETGASVRDPVCGMSVDPKAGKPSADHDETRYHFCGERCKAKFIADPLTYLRPADTAAAPGAIYTCPMHPEIRQSGPGSCSICGMALEPAMPTAATEPNPDLVDMTRRLWIGAALAIPLLLLDMGGELTGIHPLPPTILMWVEFLLATPVVLWAGWPFYERGWASVRNRSLNMFSLIALGVAAAYLYSLAATMLPSLFPAALRRMGGTIPVYYEASSVIIVLVLVGQVLELRARDKTGGALRVLLDLAPRMARRLRDDGHDEAVPLEQVMVGDRLRVRPGDKVPVDGSVLDGSSNVDEAMVTGEAMPVAKAAGAKLIGGTMNGNGALVMRAEKVGADTMLARIVAMVADAQRSRAPIQRLADVVASWFVPAVIAVAIIAAGAWLLWGPPPSFAYALVAGVSVLIIACPCALGLATPMSIMVGIGRGASAGILIRNADALERLETIDTLVVDKTGTLTEGRPRVAIVVPAAGFTEADILAFAGALERSSEHPLAAAIVAASRERGIEFPAAGDFASQSGVGVTGLVDGRRIDVGNGKLVGAGDAALEDQAYAQRRDGATIVYVAIDGRLAGFIAIADPIKATTAAALDDLRRDGIRIVMLTGDNRRTAEAIAQRLGITEVEAESLPEHKNATVRRLKAEGRIVAMAGDGINDAPALAAADVGIAMGTGTDIAIESAGVTLIKGDLAGIARARALSRATMRNIRQNLVLAFVYNGLGVPLAAGVLYPAFGWLLSPMIAAAAMSLSSVSVIGNALRLRAVRL
jgi:Cu+-exporting ATPase